MNTVRIIQKRNYESSNLCEKKIDACSNLIFHNTQYMFHHYIETGIEGNIWAPSHLYPQSLSSEKVGRNIISDDGYYDDAIL